MSMSSKRNNFWNEIKRPIKMLAPMAGYTDAAFRLLCRELGADVTMSELVSADAIAFAKFKTQKEKIKTREGELCFNKVTCERNRSTADLLSFFENERPFVIQLFGKDPENFGKAAKWISENLKPDGIDINMGCPARKVVNSGHGSALMKTPDLAALIVKAVKENTDLPVSVKTRLGWQNDEEILEFAPFLERAGIDAITIHGRTYKDGFKNKARWDNIFKVKEILGDKIIVIGNGDIQQLLNINDQLPILSCHSQAGDSHDLGIQASKATQLPGSRISSLQYGMTEGISLDGFAIGRATFGHPWIFEENAKVKTKNEKILDHFDSDGQITITGLKKIILRHAELAQLTKGEKGIMEFRKHLLSYLKGFPGAKDVRKSAVSVCTFDDVEKIIHQL